MLLRTICAAGLLLTLVPACVAFGGAVSEPALKNLMAAGMVLWFAGATPLFVKRTPG